MRIFWYCPLTMFEDFEEMEDNPSFRLRCLLTHQKLLENGHYSKIAHSVYEIEDPDIVILMSFGETELDLARWVKNRGACLIHDYSENIRGIPVLEETKKLCDAIVCCSTTLCSYEKIEYPDKVWVVKDPIEESSLIHNPRFSNNRLKVAWMGMGGNADWVGEVLKPIVENYNMEYVEISNRPEATITWDRKTWKTDFASCDIALCPQLHWDYPAKSNVKVTTAIGLGLPVVASPLHSYTEIITTGYNGFICQELEHWGESLNMLRSKEVRDIFVERSREFLPFYSLDFIYREWEAVFNASLRSIR